MQATQPLGVAHVGFAPWDVFGIAGVDQHDLEAALLEDLEHGDPVDAGGFHGHGANAAAFEPIGETVQVAGEGAERGHRFGVAVGRHGGHVHGGADVDRRRMGMDRGHCGTASFAPSCVLLLVGPRRGWGMRSHQFPNRDHRAGVTTLKSAPPHGPRFLTGSYASKNKTAAPLRCPS